MKSSTRTGGDQNQRPSPAGQPQHLGQAGDVPFARRCNALWLHMPRTQRTSPPRPTSSAHPRDSLPAHASGPRATHGPSGSVTRSPGGHPAHWKKKLTLGPKLPPAPHCGPPSVQEVLPAGPPNTALRWTHMSSMVRSLQAGSNF